MFSSLYGNTYLLTVYIWLAPSFCKSQKWVPGATICPIQLVGKKNTKSKKPLKYLLRHNNSMYFYFSSCLRRTNLLTIDLFFYSFKNVLAFCRLHFVICVLRIYANGKKKNPQKYKGGGSRLPESYECDRAIVFYSIPTFIIDSFLSQFNSIDVCIKSMHGMPGNTLRAQFLKQQKGKLTVLGRK